MHFCTQLLHVASHSHHSLVSLHVSRKLQDKHRNMRLAAIKRKSMADTQCMPGNTAFGLHPPQQALHLRHSHYLPVTLTS